MNLRVAMLCLAVCARAMAADEKAQVLEGFVYPIKDASGAKVGELRGARATVGEKGMINVQELEWVSAVATGDTLRVTTPRCRFNPETKVISSYSEIAIEKGGMRMTGTGYVCDVQSKRLVIVDNARVEFDNIELWSRHASKKE